MNTTGTRIIIDINVFITIIGKKSPNRWIFDRIISGEFQLCVSNEILWEYEEILSKKANELVSRNVIDFLLISPFVHKADIFFNWHLISEDPDDDKFIDCYLSSDAVFLVSNDQHFDRIRHVDFPKINLYSLKEFELEFRKE
ncbi:MAG TPA: putative toxin-antitoxin system toxin component, PIN family [Prolixibacteraceae bacterium]|jgi:putative PIN family toxin of toxin-antitoxin system|nr:putative toxin-antitoxin system toxin component, PIN family [Prolixibacteraceae bacterium]